MNSVNAQKISSHHWKDRVLVIFTDDIDSQSYKDQINEFEKNRDGLIERKVVVYHVNLDQYKMGFSDSEWCKSIHSLNKIRKSETSFEVVLIGLDGGFKLSKTSTISCEELFGTIDIMPMRRQEIKKKN